MKKLIKIFLLFRFLITTVLAFVGTLAIATFPFRLPGGSGVEVYFFVVLFFLGYGAIWIGFVRYSVYDKQRKLGVPDAIRVTSVKYAVWDILKILVWALLLLTGACVLFWEHTNLMYYDVSPVWLTVILALLYTALRSYKALTVIIKGRGIDNQSGNMGR